jgi:hypothetical protein
MICHFIGVLSALLIAFGDFAVALLASKPRANFGLPLLLGMTMTPSTNAFWWPSSSSTENEGQATNEEQTIKVETPLPGENEKDPILDADKQQQEQVMEEVQLQENQQPEANTANEDQKNYAGTNLTEKEYSNSEVAKQQQEQVMEEVQLEQNEPPEEEIEEDQEEAMEEEKDQANEEEEEEEEDFEEEEEEEEHFEEEVEEEEDFEEENIIQAWFHNKLNRAIELFYVDSETGEKHPAAPEEEHIVKSDHMVAILTGHGHVFHAYPVGGNTNGEPIQTFEINADNVNEEDGSLTFRIEL